jgi:hypothetical protein
MVELKDRFDLEKALHWGLLPKVQEFATDRERMAYLNSYALSYINEIKSTHGVDETEVRALARTAEDFPEKFVELYREPTGHYPRRR